MVLTTLRDLQGDMSGYVEDSRIAVESKMQVSDVRDWLETLESKGLVERARRTEGFSAYVTAKGKQTLRMSEPLPKANSASQGTGDSGQSVSLPLNDFIRYPSIQSKPSITLAGMNKVLGWKLSDSELEYSRSLLSIDLGKLQRLTAHSRLLFLHILERAQPNTSLFRVTIGVPGGMAVMIDELEGYLRLEPEKLRRELAVLEHSGMIQVNQDAEGNGYIEVIACNSGWNAWPDIKQYAETSGISLNDIIVMLDFSLLDRV